MLDPAMDTSTAAGELIFHMFGAMASFERKLMLERQREGIAKARAEGRYTGRKPTVRNQAETIRAMMADGDGPSVIAPQTQGRALVGLRCAEGLPEWHVRANCRAGLPQCAAIPLHTYSCYLTGRILSPGRAPCR